MSKNKKFLGNAILLCVLGVVFMFHKIIPINPSPK